MTTTKYYLQCTMQKKQTAEKPNAIYPIMCVTWDGYCWTIGKTPKKYSQKKAELLAKELADAMTADRPDMNIKIEILAV